MEFGLLVIILKTFLFLRRCSIGIDTGTHGRTLPCLKWASTFPLALFSHSTLQFNWNIKKTGWCTGSLVPFLFISLTWVALSERRRLSVLLACFKLNVLELYHSQNTVKFHLQIKVCVVKINSKVPTSGGNVFIENVRNKEVYWWIIGWLRETNLLPIQQGISLGRKHSCTKSWWEFVLGYCVCLWLLKIKQSEFKKMECKVLFLWGWEGMYHREDGGMGNVRGRAT